MKRIIAIAMALVLAASVLAGCQKRDDQDKGAILTMYFIADPTNVNLDPAKVLYSADIAKLLTLFFEGLTQIDSNGKVQKALATKWYTQIDEKEGVYKLFFELRDTRWSDGVVVTADDIVYAWKRILEPEFASPATVLLYPIKNARAVKAGNMTVDDLGLAALDEKLLEITFEGPFDLDNFLEACASISLVPVRESTISQYGDEWTAKPISFVTNGPFSMKKTEYAKGMTVERSTYYRTSQKVKEAPDKYVTPYRLEILFANNIDRYAADFDAALYIPAPDGSNAADKRLNLFYLGTVPKDRFEEYRASATVTDLMSYFSFYFNADRAPFTDARVRQALSIALDREEIARIVGLGVKPATGYIVPGVFDIKSGSSFRAVRGDVIPKTGDVEKAKSLLSAAGVRSGSFSVSVRGANPAEVAVAEYAASVWRTLGFTVRVEQLRGTSVQENFYNTNYDIMGVDYQAVSTDAFSQLAIYALPFSGEVVEFLDETNSIEYPHMTGFHSLEYDALVEEIYGMTDKTAKYEKLFSLEQKLFEFSPIAPLYFNANVEVSRELSGFERTIFGTTLFTKVKLKDYTRFTEPTTTQALRTTEPAVPAQ